MSFVLVDDVCYEPFLQACGVIAASFVVVGDDIIHETSIASIDASSRSVLFPLCHTYTQHTLVTLAEEYCLDIGTFALPSVNLGGILDSMIRYFVQAVEAIARTPTCLQTFCQLIP